MTRVAPGRPGRPAAATREAALALATKRFLAGERIDVQAIARELGLARATMHRWFLRRARRCSARCSRRSPSSGCARSARRSLAAARLRCSRRSTASTASSRRRAGLRVLLAQEQERALRILTSSGGIVQPRVVAAIEQIDRGRGARRSLQRRRSRLVRLAYAIVRLGEAFLYNDAIVGIRGDTERLREIEGALLGVA